MHATDRAQLALFIGLLALLTKPLGIYLAHVLDANGKTFLDPAFGPLERLTYRLMGVKPGKEHDWKRYTLAMLLFSFAGVLFTYLILRFQHYLPLNPQGLPGLSDHLAFNTAISFTTNTNWQSYGGESTMSYFSLMVGLTIHNFTSAAVGIGTTLGHIHVDYTSHCVTVHGAEVHLTPTEYALFKVLARHAGKVVTIKHLLREVWGANATEQSQYLRVYANRLRQKLALNAGPGLNLVNDPGVGYRLVTR
jgi:hypothetical protein